MSAPSITSKSPTASLNSPWLDQLNFEELKEIMGFSSIEFSPTLSSRKTCCWFLSMFFARSVHTSVQAAQVSLPSVRQTCTDPTSFEAKATTPMMMPARPEKPAPSSRILSEFALGTETSAFKIASAKSSSAGQSRLPVESIFSDRSLLTSFKSYWSGGTWNSRKAC